MNSNLRDKVITMRASKYLSLAITREDKYPEVALEKLFKVVARNNPKRTFLFASKVIGKYLAAEPAMLRVIGHLLAGCYQEEVHKMQPVGMKEMMDYIEADEKSDFPIEDVLNHKYKMDKKTLFVGFAETATGLAHSTFTAFEGDCSFIHTTRDQLIAYEANLTFEEVHSHAVEHICHIKQIADLSEMEQIILIDDELTTGNTALNLIKEIHKESKAKDYVVMAILDWRSKSDVEKAQRLEKELDIHIHFISLIRGKIDVSLQAPIEPKKKATSLELPLCREDVHVIESEDKLFEAAADSLYETLHIAIAEGKYYQSLGGDKIARQLHYIPATGRFGLTTAENKIYEKKMREIGAFLAEKRCYEKCLCIGTEEFIYIPCFISSYMGEKIKFESSARSPIILDEEEEYAVFDAITYKRPEDQSVDNYLYNIGHNLYEEVFWFFERDQKEAFKAAVSKEFSKRGIKKVHFVICDGENNEDNE